MAIFTLSDNNLIVGIEDYEEDIEFPDELDGVPVVGISVGLFENNTTIRKVTIPDSYLYIGRGAFANSYIEYVEWEHISHPKPRVCKEFFCLCSRKRIQFKEGFLYTIVGNEWLCKPVESNVFSNRCVIDSEAFSHCSRLKVFEPCMTLGVMGMNALADCPQLEEMLLYSNVYMLGERAMDGCDGIQRLVIGTKNCTFFHKSIPSVASNGYISCANFTDIAAITKANPLNVAILDSKKRTSNREACRATLQAMQTFVFIRKIDMDKFKEAEEEPAAPEAPNDQDSEYESSKEREQDLYSKTAATQHTAKVPNVRRRKPASSAPKPSVTGNQSAPNEKEVGCKEGLSTLDLGK